MIIKSYISLDLAKASDAAVSKKIAAVGVRVIARKFDVSPAMVSLFASGNTSMCAKTAEKIVKYVKRVKVKNV